MIGHGLTRGDRYRVRNLIFDDVPATLVTMLDQHMYTKMDANVNLFAFDNCVFDTRRFIFRPILREDGISHTTMWDYQASEATKHRAALEAFFERLMPVKDERVEAISYIASLLSGRRNAQRFLCVVGDGNNYGSGKTTFLRLLRTFFGRHGSSDVRAIGSNLEGGMRGKRLITHEYPQRRCVKKDFLRKYTEDADVLSRDGSFTWQAGFVFALNGKNLPGLASVGGMLAIPLRTSFIDACTYGGGFPTSLLDEWCSAFADILIDALKARVG